MFEGVISLETFPFVEWHKAELKSVPSFAPFFVSCKNMASASRILHLALFTFHDFLKHMFLHTCKNLPGCFL
jgi:hypothetical protein